MPSHSVMILQTTSGADGSGVSPIYPVSIRAIGTCGLAVEFGWLVQVQLPWPARRPPRPLGRGASGDGPGRTVIQNCAGASRVFDARIHRLFRCRLDMGGTSAFNAQGL